MRNILNMIVAVVSSLVGLYLSPRLGLGELAGMGLNQISKYSIIVGGWLCIVSAINGYDLRMLIGSKIDFGVNLFISSLVGVVMSFFTFYIVDYTYYGRWVLVISLLAFNLLTWIVYSWGRLYRPPKVYIFGGGAVLVKEYLTIVNTNGRTGVFVFIDSSINDECLTKVINNMRGGDRAYLVPDDSDSFRINNDLLDIIKGHQVMVATVSQIIERELLFCTLESITWLNLWEVPTRMHDFSYSSTRRLFDVLAAISIGLTTAPILFIAAFLVKLHDGGPVFYKQVRLGLFGKPFEMFKIRTMSMDAESNGVQWASVGDKRVTRIGRLLRKTRIDEVPQLWNIILGDMSLIGPRPERPEMYNLIGLDVPQFKLRLACKPGLTGWAQVNYPYGSSIKDSQNKLYYDIYYIKCVSWLLDLRIATRTVVAMVKGAR